MPTTRPRQHPHRAFEQAAAFLMLVLKSADFAYPGSTQDVGRNWILTTAFIRAQMAWRLPGCDYGNPRRIHRDLLRGYIADAASAGSGGQGGVSYRCHLTCSKLDSSIKREATISPGLGVCPRRPLSGHVVVRCGGQPGRVGRPRPLGCEAKSPCGSPAL
jgi:hypothetical protein